MLVGARDRGVDRHRPLDLSRSVGLGQDLRQHPVPGVAGVLTQVGLRDVGVVEGDRRDHFVAETDLWEMLTRIAAERKRLEKDLAKAQKELDQTGKKLGNEAFLSKAPEAVVEKIRTRQQVAQEEVERITARLEGLK